MSETAIKNAYANIQRANKEFAKRVSFEKFIEMVECLNIIESKYLTNEFQNCDSLVFRNIKMIENCPAIAIRSNPDKVNEVCQVLKQHKELELLADGFSLLYSDATNLSKMLSYLKKQNYYSFLGKKTTLLTNGNYMDMVKISELFKEVFTDDEQKNFFSRASIVLSKKFETVKEIFLLLKRLHIPNDNIIFCSSIFTRNDANKIKDSLESMETLKQYFIGENDYKEFLEENLSILATSKTNHLSDIIVIIKEQLEKNPDVFTNITLGDFIKDCSSILSRGKTEVVGNAFNTFKEYEKLSILNYGKRPLIEERRKICSLMDLMIEEGLESQISDHTSVFHKNYGTVFSRIGYLKEENIFNPNDENIVKIVMAKDFHWKGSKHRKLDLYISTLYNSYVNAERQSKILDNKDYENLIRKAKKENYPFKHNNEITIDIIKKLDENYKTSNTIYNISGELISRIKVIRNLNIIMECDGIDINKAILSSVLFCKIADESVINKIKQEIETLNITVNKDKSK
jgi:hypothetical protein